MRMRIKMNKLYRLEGQEPVEEPNPDRWIAWWRRANTTIGDDCFEKRHRGFVREMIVHTRFTGVDERPGFGKPALFATTIVVAEVDDIVVDVVERYDTWTLAEQGHQHYVARMRS